MTREIPKFLLVLSMLVFPPGTASLLLILGGLGLNWPLLVLGGAYSLIGSLALGAVIAVVFRSEISKRVSSLTAETKYLGWLWICSNLQFFTTIDIFEVTLVSVILVRSIPATSFLQLSFIYSVGLTITLGFLLVNLFPRLIFLNIFGRPDVRLGTNSEHAVSSLSTLAKYLFRQEIERGLGCLYSALDITRELLRNRGLSSNDLERSIIIIRTLRRFHADLPYFPLFRLSSALTNLSRIEDVTPLIKDFLTSLGWPLDFEVSRSKGFDYKRPEIILPLLVGLVSIVVSLLIPIYQTLFPPVSLLVPLLTGPLVQASIFLDTLSVYFAYVLYAPIKQLLTRPRISLRDLGAFANSDGNSPPKNPQPR